MERTLGQARKSPPSYHLDLSRFLLPMVWQRARQVGPQYIFDLAWQKLTDPPSYYIHIVLDQIGVKDSGIQLLINGVLQFTNIVVATGMCFFVDRLGRRLLFLVSTGGMFVVFVIWTICSAQFEMHHSKDSANAVIVMIFLYYVFYNTAWAGLLVGYGVEIMPYNLRAKVLEFFFKLGIVKADRCSGLDCHVLGD
jgi:MFS family permease